MTINTAAIPGAIHVTLSGGNARAADVHTLSLAFRNFLHSKGFVIRVVYSDDSFIVETTNLRSIAR